MIKAKIFTKINYKKLIIIIFLFVVAIAISLFFCKNLIVNYIVKDKLLELNTSYNINVSYNTLKIKGLNTLYLSNLKIWENKEPALLTLDSLEAKIDFPSLLLLKIKLQQILINELKIDLIKKDSISNYDFLFKTQDSSKIKKNINIEDNHSSFGRTSNNIFGLLTKFIPKDGNINFMQICERRDSNFVRFNISALQIKDYHLSTQVSVCEDNQMQKWQIVAVYDKSTNCIKAKSTASPSSSLSYIKLPYLARRFGAQITLDSLAFSIKQQRLTRDSAEIQAKMNISGLNLYHQAISPEQINLNKASFNYKLHLGRRCLELDSSSTFIINSLSLSPYIRLIKNTNNKGIQIADPLAPWHLTISLNKALFNSQLFFESLPKGLFENLEGLKTVGKLAYNFYLDVDFSNPDSLKLSSSVLKDGFRLESFGKEDLSKMSREFLYTAYEKSQAIRTFPVGKTWENFTPLDSIPPILKNVVLQSEDGSFMGHNGFLPDAFREALIYDIKVKKFARGASTISMQLVKNVFLNKKKNIARKLEEAIIVWLIESRGLTSKSRMLEVYFNIIEWGPNVYGIKEAAQFYFSKRVSELSLEECIYLASIIPKPKHYQRYFTSDNRLNPAKLDYYFRRIAAILAKKGLITDEEALVASPLNVILNGNAVNFGADTLNTKSSIN